MKPVRVFVFIGLTFLVLFPANYSQADSSSCNFTRSLTVDLRGVDVTCLQLYLQAQGFFKYSGGPTGYFGPITRASVANWQAANGVAPTWGYFGPISRAKYKEITTAVSPSKQITGETFSLPLISNQEIIIDSSGINNTESYITYFLSNSSEISFDGQKFEKVLKDENGIFLLTPQLTEKAIKQGISQEIKNSLLVQKEFIEAKLVFLKSIKVSGETVSLHKKMLGFDKLTLELIQKTLDLESNKISKTELDNYLGKYNALAEIERNKLLKEVGLIAEEPNIFKKLITWLGIEDWFYAWAAVLPPFGGMLGPLIPCLCNGFLVPVGPPTPPAIGSLFVPYTFIGSPLFYLYKQMHPGAWWLGLYDPVVMPCLNPVCLGACCPTGYGNLIYITGTSM